MASIAEGGGHTRAFTYNDANRMETVTVGGLLEATYTYDARGLQVKRVLANGQTFHMIHDQMGRRIADYEIVSGTPSLLVEYIWLDDRLTAVVINNGTTSGFYNYIHADHMNRPTAAFAGGANGPQSAGITYTPFGETYALNGTTPPDLGFPGQWFREESGLFQNWMRDYDPSLGAYIQPDPLGLVDGSAMYRYALGNPMQYTDPRGEKAPLRPPRNPRFRSEYHSHVDPGGMGLWPQGGGEMSPQYTPLPDPEVEYEMCYDGCDEWVSYTVHFDNGVKYHGKGRTCKRARISARDKERKYGVRRVRIECTLECTEDNAFRAEHIRIWLDGGPGLPNNYNLINQPGLLRNPILGR